MPHTPRYLAHTPLFQAPAPTDLTDGTHPPRNEKEPHPCDFPQVEHSVRLAQEQGQDPEARLGEEKFEHEHQRIQIVVTSLQRVVDWASVARAFLALWLRAFGLELLPDSLFDAVAYVIGGE